MDFDCDELFNDDDDDDCGMFPCEGTWACMQIGSEPCEFCPNRHLLGTSVDDDDDSENATVEPCGREPRSEESQPTE